jgi:Lipocalin-like domain
VTYPGAAHEVRAYFVSAIGGHNFNLKIDLASIAGAVGACVSALANPFARASKELKNSPEEKHHESTCHTRAGDHSTAVLGSRLISKRFPCSKKSLKDQLVGTWTLVSSDQVRPDGSRLKQFGDNPKGINVFEANGRFFVMVASADNSQIASNGRSRTNSEEDGLIVESIAYYGTYTVNEEVNVISLHLDASTFPNQVGTDQKRTITSFTANELKYSSPAAISGVQVHQVWKRAE